MRRTSWKIRNYFQVQPQIVFQGHILQLRYREGKDKAYTIREEYFPKPKDALNRVKGNATEGGIIPSACITAESIGNAKKALILASKDTPAIQILKEKLKGILKDKDYESINWWEQKGKFWFLRFASEDQAKIVCLAYKDQLKKEADYSLSTFG